MKRYDMKSHGCSSFFATPPLRLNRTPGDSNYTERLVAVRCLVVLLGRVVEGLPALGALVLPVVGPLMNRPSGNPSRTAVPAEDSPASEAGRMRLAVPVKCPLLEFRED